MKKFLISALVFIAGVAVGQKVKVGSKGIEKA